jgi:hypothetical protein
MRTFINEHLGRRRDARPSQGDPGAYSTAGTYREATAACPGFGTIARTKRTKIDDGIAGARARACRPRLFDPFVAILAPMMLGMDVEVETCQPQATKTLSDA